MAIRLTTLGTVRVRGGETEFTDLPSQRLRFALLVYLAVERDVSRDDVLVMFWPDRDTARGKHALRQMLYELRQVLGDEWIELHRDRLITSAVVDATDFEAAALGGRTGEAVGLYGGAFLAGFPYENRAFESWVERRRAHLARLHRKLCREHIASLAVAGETEAALTAARRWVELDPLEDEAAHALIERLVAAGQRTAALQYFEKYERQLADELKVEPLAETQALIAAVRQSGNATAVPTPPIRPSTPTSTPTLSTVPPEESPVAVTVDAASAKTNRRRRASRWLRGSTLRQRAGVAVLAIVLLVAVAALGTTRRVGTPLGGVRPIQIAMLPIDDQSPDGSLGPLANELTDQMGYALAQSSLLSVRSRNAVLLLRSQGTPEDSLGRLLGADYLVGGSVSISGERVYVSVELLDGRGGDVVRTATVDRPRTESRILVEDVVREMTEVLRRNVSSHVEIARVRAHTTSEDAWRHVLEAKALQGPLPGMLREGQFAAVQRAYARADSMLALAADLDRRWAEPLVQRGWVLERRAFVARAPGTSEPMSRHDLLVEALRMSDRAESRNALDPGVHALRGAALHQLALLNGAPPSMARRRIAEAEASLRRATELDPLNQNTWRRLAELLSSTERYDEAKAAALRAYRLDPYSSEVNTLVHLLFTTSFEVGADDQAESWCLEGRRRFPDQYPYLYCLLALHAWADGIEADPALLHRAIQGFRPSRMQPQLPARFEAMIAAAYARAGEPDTARAMLDGLALMNGDPALLWLRAGAHVALGDDSAAIALLGDWIERNGEEGLRVARNRAFSRLRGDPDYERLFVGTSDR